MILINERQKFFEENGCKCFLKLTVERLVGFFTEQKILEISLAKAECERHFLLPARLGLPDSF